MEKEIDNTNFRTLTIDVDKYQELLDDVDIPDEQKLELIETLWNIVVQFIDLGFGIHPVQRSSASARDESQIALSNLIKEFAETEKQTEKEKVLEGADE